MGGSQFDLNQILSCQWLAGNCRYPHMLASFLPQTSAFKGHHVYVMSATPLRGLKDRLETRAPSSRRFPSWQSHSAGAPRCLVGHDRMGRTQSGGCLWSGRAGSVAAPPDRRLQAGGPPHTPREHTETHMTTGQAGGARSARDTARQRTRGRGGKRTRGAECTRRTVGTRTGNWYKWRIQQSVCVWGVRNKTGPKVPFYSMTNTEAQKFSLKIHLKVSIFLQGKKSTINKLQYSEFAWTHFVFCLPAFKSNKTA